MIKKTILLFLFVFLNGATAAEMASAARGVSLSGTVLDSLMDIRIEYANVVLYESGTQSQVTGTVTSKDGSFVLHPLSPGEYNVSIKYMGYHEKEIENIVIARNERDIDLGILYLEPAIIMLEGVETTAERSAVEYQIDKKVVNVDKQYTAASGTAVDVLENVPSVSVDIEGNVSLRGSSGFRVLIDGRPSILDASDALKRIPASSIDNIEIITNPSAKYDPDGTSGIINVVLKKNSMNGVNGLITTYAGNHEQYGGDVQLSYRTEKYNAFMGMDYKTGSSPGSSRQKSITMRGDTTFTVDADGDRLRNYKNYGIRTGFDWFISDSDVLGIALSLGDRLYQSEDELFYEELQTPGAGTVRYTSLNDNERGGGFGSGTVTYSHQFDDAGHEIYAEADMRFRGGDDISRNELINSDGSISSGQQSTESGPGYELYTKFDYSKPFGEKNTLQAGYQSRIGTSTEETTLSEYDIALGDYRLQPAYSNETQYDRTIHSLYGLYGGEIGRLGYQGGLRGEYTYRTVELVEKNENFTIDRWDYFPTAHLSLDLGFSQQMMTSYTRRIDRPRGYYLEPFITIVDAYNVRQGNPDIKPEYIDSYEAGYQKNIGKNLLSFQVYHRITHNKIERVQSVYEDNVVLRSVANVGTDYTTGIESMINWDVLTWWNVNVMGSLFNYKIKGVLYDEPFSRTSENWGANFNNTINFGTSTRLQINTFYQSPSVSAQGRREAFFGTHIALRQTFFNDHLELIFQARDIFQTSRYEYSSEGQGFYREGRYTRESPIFTFTVNYLINNYKRDKSNGGSSGGGMDFDEM